MVKALVLKTSGYFTHAGSSPVPSAMARVVFRNGDQQGFIEQVKEKSRLDWEALGKIVGVSGRTLRDWRIEKFLGSYKALLQLSKFSGVKIPGIREIRKEYWNVYKIARKGGFVRNFTYGNPGTKVFRLGRVA